MEWLLDGKKAAAPPPGGLWLQHALFGEEVGVQEKRSKGQMGGRGSVVRMASLQNDGATSHHSVGGRGVMHKMAGGGGWTPQRSKRGSADGRADGNGRAR